MTTGEKILRCRQEKGLSQRQLADRLQLTEQAVRRLEEGQTPLRRTVALRLADALDGPLDKLLDWPDLPEKAAPADRLPQLPVLGLIRAGVPLFTGAPTAPQPAGWEQFFLRAEDDSLAADGIPAGSRILFSARAEPEDGDLVVCSVGGGEPVICRLFRRCEGPVLTIAGENQNFSQRDLQTGWLRILGVAQDVVRRL